MRNSSRSRVDPFIVMDVMEAARRAEDTGRDIIHMEVGQPGTGAPAGALKAVRDALGADPMGYTVALGRPDLRARIARLYRDWYGVDLDPARVYRVVTIDYMHTNRKYEPLGSGANVITGGLCLDAVIDHIGAHSPVAPQVEGRMRPA